MAEGIDTRAASAPRFSSSCIREYYDANTPAFVRFGDGRRVGAIHRAVWAPGVRNMAEALEWVDARVADVVRALPPCGDPRHVVDLGCGVGASLCHLASRLGVRGTGITLSAVQATAARARVEAAGLADRVAIVEGDFCSLPETVAEADVAYAIEAFVHAPDAAAFMTSCRRVLKPGGTLVVCDDVRGAGEGGHDAEAEAEIDRFRRGWQVNSLLSTDELTRLAREAGFDVVEALDLTSYLRLGRPRDRAIDAALVPLDWIGWRSPRVDAWRGGSALQVCLAKRWIEYRLVTLRRLS